MPKGDPGTPKAHQKPDAIKCPDSWWTKPLTWNEFREKAYARVPDMRKRGVSHLIPFTEIPLPKH